MFGLFQVLKIWIRVKHGHGHGNAGCSKPLRKLTKQTLGLINAYVPRHALHEQGLQGQWGVGTLVRSQERRAAVVPVVNRGFCSPIGLHRVSFFRASEESFRSGRSVLLPGVAEEDVQQVVVSDIPLEGVGSPKSVEDTPREAESPKCAGVEGPAPDCWERTG